MKHTICDSDGAHVLRLTFREIHDLKMMALRLKKTGSIFTGGGNTFNINKVYLELTGIPTTDPVGNPSPSSVEDLS